MNPVEVNATGRGYIDLRLDFFPRSFSPADIPATNPERSTPRGNSDGFSPTPTPGAKSAGSTRVRFPKPRKHVPKLKATPILTCSIEIISCRYNEFPRLGTDPIKRYLTGFANYSWQARPESKDFDISILNLPPTHRFNAGISFDYKRYLGNLSVGYVGSAYWNDVLNVTYSGSTKAYTVVTAGAGLLWGGSGRYLAMLKVSNLANTPILNHVFGDILKRQIIGEFRMRF